MPIDVHTHFAAPELVDFLAREGGRYATRVADEGGQRWFVIKETARRPINARLCDLPTRLREMDARSVRVQALSCPPFMIYPEAGPAEALAVAQMVNDTVAASVARRPDRFVGLASVPLQAPEEAARELERAHARLGLRGAQIGTSVLGRALDEPELEPFWAAASELGMPVALHPFDAAPAGPLGRYYLGNVLGNPTETALAAALLIFGGVLERFPNLRVVLYHAGGALPAVLGRLDHGWRVRPECRAAIPRPPGSYAGQLWFDIIAHDRATLAHLVDRFGPERVVLGSDFPFDMGLEQPVAAVRELGLAPDAMERILSGNARALLDMDGPRG